MRRARSRRGGALGGLLLQLHELRGVLALDAALDERPQRGADRVERFGQLRRGAPRGGGGVVELVREPAAIVPSEARRSRLASTR